MNYEEMSNFEINCAVAYHIGLSTVERAENREFDPCNSWVDAGSISEQNLISIDYHDNGTYVKVWGYSDTGLHSTSVLRNDIKRGICIVFLMMMMKEADNG